MRNKYKNKQPKEIHRGRITKKTPYGRIIATRIIGGVEWSYHATKGWRAYRSTV